VVPRLELRVYILSKSISHFYVRNFRDRVSWTVCPGWIQTTYILMSASWVAMIRGMNHQHLVHLHKICIILLMISMSL
jgi:hypothetical protein